MTAGPTPRLQLIPRAAQRIVPWRNGQGSTREVAIEPPGATTAGPFRWRVSCATVASDGPFSRFPGVDRSLWLLAGNGIVLDVDGRQVRLEARLQRLDFAGETAIGVRLIDGPVEDLNVMVDRARVAAACAIVQLDAGERREQRAPAGLLLVLAVHGSVAVAVAQAGAGAGAGAGARATLSEGDALRITEPIGVPPLRLAPLQFAAGAAPAAVLVAGFAARAGTPR